MLSLIFLLTVAAVVGWLALQWQKAGTEYKAIRSEIPDKPKYQFWMEDNSSEVQHQCHRHDRAHADQ